MAQRLEPFAALAPLILICHCPPLGTALDRARDGVHIGSRAVAEFLPRTSRRHSSPVTCTRPKAPAPRSAARSASAPESGAFSSILLH